MMKSFVSIHDTRCSDDMRKIDLVYKTVAALNAISPRRKFDVEIEYTNGIDVVPQKVARFAETFIYQKI